MKSITLTLPYGISANRYWATRVITPKGGRPLAMTYVTPEAKEYKSNVIQIAREAGIVSPIFGRVELDIKLYPKRPLDWQKRMRQFGDAWDDTVMCIDIDNLNKVLLDSLKNVAIEDDKWVRRLTSERMEPDEHGARVVVTITPIARAIVQENMFSEVE